MGAAAHAAKITALRAALQAAGAPRGEATFGLAKPTSNLFRDVARAPTPRINLRHFNEVVEVGPAAGTVTAEGMTTYADLVDATLARGGMPCVVPQLKSITLGGALAGVGLGPTIPCSRQRSTTWRFYTAAAGDLTKPKSSIFARRQFRRNSSAPRIRRSRCA